MGKKKQLIILNVIIIIVAVIYALVLILGNVYVTKATVATIDGSYGNKYAKSHHLNQVELTDDMLQYFDERYETFEFNIKGNHLELLGYEGISKKLVIPSRINTIPVTTLTEDFMKSIDNVETIYIPDSVKSIDGEARDSVTIYCASSSEFYKEIHKQDDKNKGWNIDVMADSEFVNFALGDIPFSYNIKDGKAEIVYYNGDDSDLIVIPSYINGYQVTDISMDLVGLNKTVVIPETVTNISGKTSLYFYTGVFFIEIIFSILSFIVALVAVNIIIPKYKSENDYLLRGNQIVIILGFVFLQAVFGITSISYLDISVYLALVISVALLATFIVLMYLSSIGIRHAVVVEERMSGQTDRMKSLKQSYKFLAEDITNPELKKQVERMIGELRFSSPTSKPELEAIENEIEEGLLNLKEAIVSNDEKKIAQMSDMVLKLLKKRNEISK